MQFHQVLFFCLFLFSFLFLNLNLFILIGGYNFTILYWFCHTSTCIRQGCTRVPHPEPRSHLPLLTVCVIPVHQPQASCILHRTWTYMILYMFQCHSPRSCHPLPLLQSPKDCLYICVSFAVSQTGLSLPSF